MASVGLPLDEAHSAIRASATTQSAAVLELLRLAHERADIDMIELAIKRDTALTFELIRFVNSAAFAVPMQVESVKHARHRARPCEITRWLSRMLRVSTYNADALPLMHAGIRRGLFLEHLASCNTTARSCVIRCSRPAPSHLLDRMTGTAFARLLQIATVAIELSKPLWSNGQGRALRICPRGSHRAQRSRLAAASNAKRLIFHCSTAMLPCCAHCQLRKPRTRAKIASRPDATLSRRTARALLGSLLF